MTEQVSQASKRPFVVHDYVRWGDVDFAGIIRWDAYTRFMELGELELFRSLGIPYRDFLEKFDFRIPRRSAHLDFESSPGLDEHLEVVVYIPKVGTTSLTMAFDIYGQGGVIRALGTLVMVCVAHHEAKSRAWPPAFLERIDGYCMSAEVAREGRAAWEGRG